MIVELGEALDRERFGGKGAALAELLRAGLEVPNGIALSVDGARAIAEGRELDALARALDGHGDVFAVRSSAVGEDGAATSFAGQHLTLLGVTADQVPRAVAEVQKSGDTAGARAYRRRLGLPPEARMAVIVQALVPADAAGVLFTVDPVTGAPDLVIEAAWGLGEAVVAGLVVPDRWRLDRSGRVLEHAPGSRDLQVIADGGASREEPVPADRAARAPLDGEHLAAIAALCPRLDAAWPGPHDVELAVSGAKLWVLQRRPVTR